MSEMELQLWSAWYSLEADAQEEAHLLSELRRGRH